MSASFGYRPGDNVMTLTQQQGSTAGITWLLSTPDPARPTFGTPESRTFAEVARNPQYMFESIVHETGHLLGFDERYSGAGGFGSPHEGFYYDFMSTAVGRTEAQMEPTHIEEAARFGVSVAQGRNLTGQVLRGIQIEDTGTQGSIPSITQQGQPNPAYAARQALVQSELIPFFRGQVTGTLPLPPPPPPPPPRPMLPFLRRFGGPSCWPPP
jgi:hypothetical protein